jgi:hypothetical protein
MLSWVVAAIAIAFLVKFIAVARQEDRDAALMRGPAESDDASPRATPRLVVDSTPGAASRSRTVTPVRPLGAIAPSGASATERVVPLGALTARSVQPADRMQRVASGGGGGAMHHQQLADRAPRATDETR